MQLRINETRLSLGCIVCPLQDYALRHLAYLVAYPAPQKMSDVDERMNKLCTYLRPSPKEVEEMVKQAEKGRKRELNLPVDRIHSRLLKVSFVEDAASS